MYVESHDDIMKFAFKPLVAVSLIGNLLLFNQMWRGSTVIYQKEFLRQVSTDSSSTEPRKTLSTVHVLFGLSGNDPGFLAEFEVALKSILLNAPLESDLTIYIMADSDAYAGLGSFFYQTGLKGSLWRNRISIETYNVAPYLGNWTKQIKSIDPKMNIKSHTIGTYFRLTAHEVLPSDVNHVLYMDTDVVIMANLDDLWEHVDQDAMFQWGEDTCAGFMILNLQKLGTIWDMARRCDLYSISEEMGQRFNDQLIFRAVNHTFPDVVAVLPKEWAISVGNGAWKHARDIVEYRPKVGMLHFSGGGGGGGMYWESAFMKKWPYTWGTGPYYYANLPWNWARFIGESMRGAGKGHPLIIRHNGTSKGNNNLTTAV